MLDSSFEDLLSTCTTSVERRDPLDIPSYMASQNLFPKFYFKCPKTGEERACLGTLITLSAPPILSKKTDPHLCFYGSIFFSTPKRQENIWQDFFPSHFFLPEIEIRQSPLKTEFITHSLQGSKSSPLEKALPLPSCTQLKEGAHIPSKETWTLSLEKVQRAIFGKKIDKVVLARRSTFLIDPLEHPLTHLQKLIHTCPSTSTFALQMAPSSLFLGSTPEKLYSRKERVLSTESIAGTRKRGQEPLEDLSLENELLVSLKDQAEVHFVKDFLSKNLSALCEEILVDKEVSIIKTDTVQHLYYGFRAHIKEGVTDADLLAALHPTPAVNGEPKEIALQLIEELEEFDRGLYAGTIGWISSSEAFFAVAIRSALIQGGSLHAFAGTGLVEGSDPHLEWIELQHKISHWTS